jgi:L-fucose mutarotase/ribose pyranase (RbsD/FucU family)
MKLHSKPRLVHPGIQRSQPKHWTELKRCNDIVISDSHFPGETVQDQVAREPQLGMIIT